MLCVTCQDIEGIEIPKINQHKRGSHPQLADDTTIFIKNEKFVIKVIEIMDNFEKISGLKMNKDKTEATLIGILKKSNKGIREIIWSKEPIKMLGVYVGYDEEKCEKLNWEPKLEKLQNTFILGKCDL